MRRCRRPLSSRERPSARRARGMSTIRCPSWLVERWHARFGADETRRLIAWNDARSALTLQPARWSSVQIQDALRDLGVGVAEAPYGAGLSITAAPCSVLPALKDLPGYYEGGWIVQDPAHALITRFAAIPPGAQVYDACAAPGGKAVALEVAGGRVLAGDARHERMGRLADTTRRAGVAI